MTDENRILAESILWLCTNTLRQLNCTYIGVQLGNRKKVVEQTVNWEKKCENRSKGLYLSSALFLSVCCISGYFAGCFLDGRLGGNNSYIIFKSTVVYPLFPPSTQLCMMSVIDSRVPQQTEDRKKDCRHRKVKVPSVMSASSTWTCVWIIRQTTFGLHSAWGEVDKPRFDGGPPPDLLVLKQFAYLGSFTLIEGRWMTSCLPSNLVRLFLGMLGCRCCCQADVIPAGTVLLLIVAHIETSVCLPARHRLTVLPGKHKRGFINLVMYD